MSKSVPPTGDLSKWFSLQFFLVLGRPNIQCQAAVKRGCLHSVQVASCHNNHSIVEMGHLLIIRLFALCLFFLLLFFLITLFAHLWLWGSSLLGAGRAFLLRWRAGAPLWWQCPGFSLQWFLSLQRAGSRARAQ